MQSTLIKIAMVISLSILYCQPSKAQCHIDDWTALKAFYATTTDYQWYNNEGWFEAFVGQNSPPLNCNLSNLYGVELDNEGRVSKLILRNNGLGRFIHPEIGRLSNLVELDLSNNNMWGSIPSEIGNFMNLEKLLLFGNSYSNNIPPELGNLSNLAELDLSDNQLSGNIPPELDNLSNLILLRLDGNQLNGNIPTELGNLSNLTELDLGSNELSGSIPPELGNLSNLTRLELYRNRLSGSIPSELGNLSNLTHLWLPNNQLSGSIPVELGNLSNLIQLDLAGNEFDGMIPTELENLSNLTILYLYNNKLSGSIPTELGNLSNLILLNLHGNQLGGRIPAELGNLSNLTYLNLYSNKLRGSIPTQLENLSNLTWLFLSINQLSGSIPAELGNLSNLAELILGFNQLRGNIPAELGNLNNLTELHLRNNYFTCTEIENFLNISQGGTFTYDPQYYNYGPISINTVESINDNTTFQLSAPFNSDDPSNLSFQWYQNDELIPSATDSILNIMVNKPSDAGLYSLQVTETCVSDIDFFSDPVIVAADGFDYRSEPIVNKQVIVQYTNAEGKLEAENSIFARYNNELAIVDSCNCNRELYLYEFEDAADQFDFVLQLNKVGKAIVILDSIDIDGGGFNYKIDLGVVSNGANSYKVSTNCEGACEDTLEVVVLDTGYRGTDSVFLREPVIPYCENALSEDYIDAGWHGTYGFNMITKDFATGDKLKVMPLKIFDEEQATLFNLICGIYHAIDNGSDVINISAGYYGTKPFEIFEDVIEEAKAKGIFIVTSAGNDSVDINEKKQYPAYFSTEHDNVISVGSIDAQANYSSFSNYGNEAVTIAAYGEDILSKAEGALRQATGTSVATFIVSKELAHEIGLDKSRSLDAVWADFEANRLIYKSDLSTKTITGKYLEVTIEQVFADDSICINLNPGWNLISFDVSPLDKSVANVFSDLQADSLDIVIGFDGGTVRYNPKGPPFLNTLKRLENGCGYWVKVQNADTLKVYGFSIEETFRKPLEVGWNLITFPQDSVQTPAVYFADLINNGNLEMVIGFDDGTVRYNPNGPPFLNTLHQLESGFGYWVKVTNSVNLKAK